MFCEGKTPTTDTSLAQTRRTGQQLAEANSLRDKVASGGIEPSTRGLGESPQCLA
jgi:hypothetical protein